jgi:cyclopropane fatty-acyl-phospholipid synthase-like methyltransferase
VGESVRDERPESTAAGAQRPRALRKRRPRGSRRREGLPLARRADKYLLYQQAVQDPEGDVVRVRRMYERLRGRPPRTLREDFCGTGAFASAWVAAHRANRAVAIDLDPEPLAWGRAHHAARLRTDQLARLAFVEGDVRTARTEPVDVLVAFNFSFFLFKTRPELLAYFRRARAHLNEDGIFVIDAYGGPESMERRTERRRIAGCTYVWDQSRFDPITHDATCYIHFEFRDGSRLRRAWAYHWRLWTVAELRDVLADAGFSRSTVYWEGTVLETNEPNGIFHPRAHADEDPAWVAYLVAER